MTHRFKPFALDTNQQIVVVFTRMFRFLNIVEFCAKCIFVLVQEMSAGGRWEPSLTDATNQRANARYPAERQPLRDTRVGKLLVRYWLCLRWHQRRTVSQPPASQVGEVTSAKVVMSHAGRGPKPCNSSSFTTCLMGFWCLTYFIYSFIYFRFRFSRSAFQAHLSQAAVITASLWIN